MISISKRSKQGQSLSTVQLHVRTGITGISERMHKKKNKKRKQAKLKPSRSHVISKIQEGFLTVNDYANTSLVHPSERNSKKLNFCITNKVQKMDIVENRQDKLEENLKWYEKDFDSEFDHIQEIDISENRDFETDFQTKATYEVSCTQSEVDTEGLVYPPDIWYLLSKHIAPEDVCRFACLCRDACAITNTVAFWRSLYYRYHNPKIKLPHFLSSEFIEGIYGVRYITICALHIMYEPFRSKIVLHGPIGDGTASPYALKNQKCRYTWSNGKPGAECTYYMLFEKTVSKADNLMKFDKDIYASNCKNQTILRVFCRSFQNLPQAEIMGLQLSEVFFNVSSDMRNHRLRLLFQRERSKVKGSFHRGVGSCVTAVLDPVVCVQLLHWWHPQFRNCMESTTIKHDSAF